VNRKRYLQALIQQVGSFALVVAGRTAGFNAVNAIVTNQFRDHHFCRAVQHHQLLTQFLEAFFEGMEAFQQEPLSLDAHAGHIAPGSVDGPQVNEQKPVCTRLSEQPRVVVKTQVVSEPVQLAHLPIPATVTIHINYAREPCSV